MKKHCPLFGLRNENVAVNVTMEDTKEASMLLIRKLFLLMQNLEALPNAVHLSMKLYYNDDGKNSKHICLAIFSQHIHCIAPLHKLIGEF